MKVLIIDDDPLITASLKMILEAKKIDIAGLGHDGSEAIHLFEQLKPDILLMDIQMKKVSGLTAAKTILAQYPEAKILLLTTFSDDDYILKALKYGVKGYLIKQDYSSIVPALTAVMTGQSVFGTEIISKIPNLLQDNEKKPSTLTHDRLSDKEIALTALVAKGLSNKEIAEKMFLSEGTIRNYLSAILDKLALRDRTQLAVFYLKNWGNV
ncbi:DNA-binding response regulator [Lactococcus hodotermopsidis]|uniref:DNA-binding response regulator n=1 Tax=Pseudolactococcus hodotermopsidis TaxID=2709157 RepID=A0A6A0BD99_9LACT|nr:response regulator transcription factor [Lactococcus hodotermopsidis]GFH43420.1 DNA-binding response regulator [Lactococcus hodotermopsidis]